MTSGIQTRLRSIACMMAMSPHARLASEARSSIHKPTRRTTGDALVGSAGLANKLASLAFRALECRGGSDSARFGSKVHYSTSRNSRGRVDDVRRAMSGHSDIQSSSAFVQSDRRPMREAIKARVCNARKYRCTAVGLSRGAGISICTRSATLVKPGSVTLFGMPLMSRQ